MLRLLITNHTQRGEGPCPRASRSKWPRDLLGSTNVTETVSRNQQTRPKTAIGDSIASHSAPHLNLNEFVDGPQALDREGFLRARRFWWLLVPIYNWVVLYRQFDDLKQAASRVGLPALNSVLAIWFVIFSWLAGNSSSRINSADGSFVAFVVSGALIAIVGSLVQPTANAYLKNQYPDAAPIGMTLGEITAIVLGILLFALVALVTFA